MGAMKRLLEDFEETKDCLMEVKDEINEVVEFIKFVEIHDITEEIESADLELMLNGIDKSMRIIVKKLIMEVI